MYEKEAQRIVSGGLCTAWQMVVVGMAWDAERALQT